MKFHPLTVYLYILHDKQVREEIEAEQKRQGREARAESVSKQTLRYIIKSFTDRVMLWRKSQSTTVARQEAISNPRNFLSLAALVLSLVEKGGVGSRGLFNMDGTTSVVNGEVDKKGKYCLYLKDVGGKVDILKSIKQLPDDIKLNMKQNATRMKNAFRIHSLFINNAVGTLGPPATFFACKHLSASQTFVIECPGVNQNQEDNHLTNGVIILGKGRALTAPIFEELMVTKMLPWIVHEKDVGSIEPQPWALLVDGESATTKCFIRRERVAADEASSSSSSASLIVSSSSSNASASNSSTSASNSFSPARASDERAQRKLDFAEAYSQKKARKEVAERNDDDIDSENSDVNDDENVAPSKYRNFNRSEMDVDDNSSSSSSASGGIVPPVAPSAPITRSRSKKYTHQVEVENQFVAEKEEDDVEDDILNDDLENALDIETDEKGNHIIFESNSLKEGLSVLEGTIESPCATLIKNSKGAVGKSAPQATSKQQPLDRAKSFVMLHSAFSAPSKTMELPGPPTLWVKKVEDQLEVAKKKFKMSKTQVSDILLVYHILYKSVHNCFRRKILIDSWEELGMIPERLNMERLMSMCIYPYKHDEKKQMMEHLPNLTTMMSETGRIEEKYFEDNNIPKTTPKKTASIMDSIPIPQQRCVLYLNETYVEMIAKKKKIDSKAAVQTFKKQLKKKSDNKKIELEKQKKAAEKNVELPKHALRSALILSSDAMVEEEIEKIAVDFENAENSKQSSKSDVVEEGEVHEQIANIEEENAEEKRAPGKKRGPYKCSKCNQTGHQGKTCPNIK
jgi:hypothetical protein